MKRVLYAYCTKPDGANRVKVLRDTLGWEPLLIFTCAAREPGFRELYSDGRVRLTDELYANVSLADRSSHSTTNLLADLEYLAPHTPGLLSLMDRFAFPDEFTTRARLHYLRELALEWGSLLDELAPDIVHFDETPHGAAYLTIYHLARRRGIRTVWFVPTGFVGYNMLGETIGAPPLRLPERDTGGDVSQELLDRIEELRSGEQFPHWYMDLQDEQSAHLGSIVEQAPETSGRRLALHKAMYVWKWPRYARHLLALRNAKAAERERARQYEQWLAEPSENMQYLHFPPTSGRVMTNAQHLEAMEARAQHKRMLESAYAAVSSRTERLDVPYVYFPLHFQPERTTNPEGGLLEDQFVAIASVHAALPPGWLLYVKEHPTQFHPEPVLASEIGRRREDYRELLRLENLRLIDMSVPSAALVRNSRATVTITGTAAWEAAVNGIPGIHMAPTWYDGFPGACYAPTFDDLSAFFAEIDSYTPTSTDAEERYLREFCRSAFRFEISEQDLPAGTVSFDEQSSGVIEAMSWWERT